jgi:WD40 repeat protein
MPRDLDREGRTPFGQTRPASVGALLFGVVSVIIILSLALPGESLQNDQNGPERVFTLPNRQILKAAAFRRDGQQLALGAEDGSISVWSIHGNSQTAHLHGPASRLYCLGFSPDGNTLASGYADGSIVLWDLKTGATRAIFRDDSDQILSLDFSPDGAVLAGGGGDGVVRLWNVAQGKVQATLQNHPGGVCAVRFAPDGRWLATGSSRGWVDLWEVPKDPRIWVSKTPKTLGSNSKGTAVQSLAFSQDATALVSGGICDNLKVWDVATGQLRTPSETEVQSVGEAIFGHDSSILFAAKVNGQLHVRHPAEGIDQTITLGNSGIRCSAFSPAGSLVALAEAEGGVTVWDLSSLVTDPTSATRLVGRGHHGASSSNSWISDRTESSVRNSRL